ncbi:hypothetical protein [Rhodoferax sp.]|uniref:hypothetical protein n=1 Tax=Rhodoferax sp. TaxID=50421 RepID=UPI0027665930|nr:hypothetical protein [Rhodoferax sp.]
MTTDSRYMNTLPAALEGDLGSNAAPGAPRETGSIDYSVLAAVGAQMDAPITLAKHAVLAWVEAGKLAQNEAKPAQDALAELHRLARDSQLLARVADGRWRQTHEQLNLDSIVKRALDERAPLLQRRGVELHRSVKPVAVIVDLDLVTTMVLAAIDCAAKPGARLFVSLDVKNWPAHAILSFKTTHAVVVSGMPGHPREEFDALSQHLLEEIARAIGVSIETSGSVDEPTLTLEFPRTVKQLEGLTAMEMDLGAESWMSAPPQALAGHRVLIVTSDIALRDDIKSTCRAMGLTVDSVPTSVAAVRYCELERPHLIIVDERFRDDQFDQLRVDLLKDEPNFPFVEVGYDSGTLSISSWMSDNMTRVTRSDLATQLPQALTLEFAKIL